MPTLEQAREAAEAVTDPELPMLTLADLGVLRDVRLDDDGVARVAITPTYVGCPAMDAMREDLKARLGRAGFRDVRVDVRLSPAWTTDDLTEKGRRALRENGLSAPGHVVRHDGPVPLNLGPVRRVVRCPRCDSAGTELTSEFGPTACTALYRCVACGEPFEHMKEI